MVRYDFPDSDVDGWFTGFDRAIGVLAETHGGDRARAATLGSALSTVLALWLLRQQDPSAPWVEQRLPAFYDHVREVLDGHRGDFAGYLAEMDLAIWRETATDWYNACFTRSVVHVLLHDVGLPQQPPMIAPDWEEDTDEELRGVGPKVPPLPADVIPHGMPEDHWWWFIASGPPEEVTYAY